MLNEVTLIGNLGKNPEIRTMQNGKCVASFTMATSESWKDKNTGERKSKSEWHNVVVFNDGLITILDKFAHKGSRIYIKGKIVTRKWQDKEGNDKYTTEIVLQGFNAILLLLDGVNSQAKDSSSSDYQNQNNYTDDLEDEIPF